jgi:pimeloyl-ACP methyl ester carboxylesterase
MWLLLRGLGRECGHWFDFPPVAERELGVPCRALDLPGFGKARHERVPASVPEMSEAILHRPASALRAASGPVGVLGLSLGGMVALELCRRAPARFSHLVLVNSSSRLSPPWQRLLPAGMLLLSRSLATLDLLERERRIYELTLSERRAQADRFAARAALLAERAPARRRDVLRQLLAALAFTPPRVTQPVLVLSGRNDRLVSPACSAALATALGAPHNEHPSAGHDLPVDDGAWLAQQMARWLAARAELDPRETLRTNSPATLLASVRDEERRPE